MPDPGQFPAAGNETLEGRLNGSQAQTHGKGLRAAAWDRIGEAWPGAGRFFGLSALLLPALAPVIILFCGALLLICIESFKPYVPGRIIQPTGAFTTQNFSTFASLPYLGFFVTTVRLAALSTLISTLLAYPVAYTIARTRSLGFRKVLITLTVLTFFLGGMARVVAFVIVLGSNGLLNSFLALLGFERLTLVGTEAGVLVGLVHFQLSVAILTLVGPITNIDPSVEEAAQSLGASSVRTFWAVTLPLSMPGILAAAMLSFAVGVSAFTIPLFLGKGRVNVISNLIYDRFSDVLNFPEGSALAVILLGMSLAITYVATYFSRRTHGALT